MLKNLSHEKEIHKWGFGMSPISQTMLKRYKHGIDSYLMIIDNKITIDDVKPESISELKGMLNRCIRKDQWDWHTVYSRLGEPPHKLLFKIVKNLPDFRKSIIEHDKFLFTRQTKILEEFGLSTILKRFFIKMKKTDSASGWIYVLSNKIDKEILKIGMTNRSIEERVKEINSVTGVVYPYSVWSLFKVYNAKEAEKIVFNNLESYRIRSDREFFKVDHKIAVETIEKCLKENDLLVS